MFFPFFPESENFSSAAREKEEVASGYVLEWVLFCKCWNWLPPSIGDFLFLKDCEIFKFHKITCDYEIRFQRVFAHFGIFIDTNSASNVRPPVLLLNRPKILAVFDFRGLKFDMEPPCLSATWVKRGAANF